MASFSSTAATVALLFLFYFRPLIALHLHQPFDEVCYMEWLYPYLGTLPPFCYSHSHLSGVVAAWLPFAQLGKWTATLVQESPGDWIEYSIGLSAFFYYGFALFLTVAFYRMRKHSATEAILLFLGVPVLHFATQDTHLTHSVEFFLSILVIYLLQKEKFWHALIFSFLLSVTRINDAPALFVVMAALLNNHSKTKSWKFLWWPVATFVTIAVLWLCYDIGFVRGYNQTWFFPLVQTASFAKIKRLLFAEDWGLVWTAPLWLFTFVVGMLKAKRLSPAGKACLFWMFVELCVVAVWRGNGRYFGHRYLLGSYAACLLIWSELKIFPWVRFVGLPLAIYSVLYLLFTQWVYPYPIWPWPMLDNHSVLAVPFGTWIGVISSNASAIVSIFADTPIGVLKQELAGTTHAFTPIQLAILMALTLTSLILIFGKSVAFLCRIGRLGKGMADLHPLDSHQKVRRFGVNTPATYKM